MYFFQKIAYYEKMEKYLTPYSLKNLQKLSAALGKDLVFVDLETTGFVHDPIFSVIEVGVVSISESKVQEVSSLINPGVKIPSHITDLTGITNSMVKNQPDFSKYVRYFNKIAQTSILMGYNSKSFDSKALEKMGRKHQLYYTFDNQMDVRYLYLRERNKRLNMKGMSGSLSDAANLHEVKLSGTAHRAGYDIALTTLVAEKILDRHGLPIVREDVDKIKCLITKSKYHNCISK